MPDIDIEIAKKSWREAPDNHIAEAMSNLDSYNQQVRDIIRQEAETRFGQSFELKVVNASHEKSRKVMLWFLFALGCLLHILFSAEGIFYGWNWNHPVYIFSVMTAYATPGIILSIIVFAPILHKISSKPHPQFHILKCVIGAVYAGFAFRVLFVLMTQSQNLNDL